MPLADAARSRCEADWLVGINGTRAMTAFNSRDGGFFLTTVGRVQTPTLSIVVEREEKIRNYVPRDYWEVRADLRLRRPALRRPLVRPEVQEGRGRPEKRAERAVERAPTRRAIAAARAAASRPRSPRKPSRARRRRRLLYDLTSLQREANGASASRPRTRSSLAQALYEKHKVLTYPRTDSRALPEDYVAVVKETMKMICDEHLPGPLRELAAHAKRR